MTPEALWSAIEREGINLSIDKTGKWRAQIRDGGQRTIAWGSGRTAASAAEACLTRYLQRLKLKYSRTLSPEQLQERYPQA